MKHIIIGDADALIALANPTDILHSSAKQISYFLIENNSIVLFPATAFSEAITTLQRKTDNKECITQTLDLFKNGDILTEDITMADLKRATDVFNPYGGKHNTFFDAIVAAYAKHLDADAIFSFDKWYRKLGFKLTEDLL